MCRYQCPEGEGALALVANLVFLAVVIHNYKVYKRVKAHRDNRREFFL